MIVLDQLRGLKDRFDRLSARERSLVGAFAITFVVMVTLIVGFLISDGLSTMAEKNEAMRQALRDIETHRDSYLKLKAKAAQLETRIGQTPIALGGYLEQAAKDAGVEIPESNEHPPQLTGGKRWMERSVDLRLNRVRVEQLANFLKKIETGPNLVVVTALRVKTRDDKHQELDVELTVATYERAAPKDKGKKDKT
jgi:type II secretory pathway component PulJ